MLSIDHLRSLLIPQLLSVQHDIFIVLNGRIRLAGPHASMIRYSRLLATVRWVGPPTFCDIVATGTYRAPTAYMRVGHA